MRSRDRTGVVTGAVIGTMRLRRAMLRIVRLRAAQSLRLEVRMAKGASGGNQPKTVLQYRAAAPRKPALVRSPFASDGGYVDVTGFPPGTEVEDPYTRKIFLTPSSQNTHHEG